MGHQPGYRQVTLYVKPELYEQVRYAAYTLGEDIFMFANEAFENAVGRRLTKAQRAAVSQIAAKSVDFPRRKKAPSFGGNGKSRDKRR